MDRRTLILLGAGAGVAATAGLMRGRAPQAAAAQRFEVEHTPGQWRALLSPAAFEVLREEGTEAPFTSPLLGEHRRGVFACGACDLADFDSRTKFESGTGWPSFYQPLPQAVKTTKDDSLMMERTEVHCRRCGSHLGHVFNDGPAPTGLRYCMNGVALKFHPA